MLIIDWVSYMNMVLEAIEENVKLPIEIHSEPY